MDRTRGLLIAAVVVTAAVVAVFASALTETYGSTDDYSFFRFVFLDGRACARVVLHEGRPLLGLAYDALGAFVTTFEDTRVFRASFVAGAVAMSLALLVVAARRFDLVAAAAMACLFGTSVPMIDLGALHPGHSVPAAAAIALLAYAMAAAGLRAAEPGARARRAALLGGAALLLGASAAVYQTAPFVFFVGLTVDVVGRRAALRVHAVHVARSTGVFAAAMALYTAVMFGVVIPLFGGAASGREGLTPHPLAKAAWFFAFPLRDAFVGPHFAADDPQLAHLGALRAGDVPPALFVDALADPRWLAVLAVVALALWRHAEGPPRARAGYVLLALSLLPLSFGLLLLIAEMWPSHRVQLAMHGVAAVLVVFAIVTLAGPARARLARLLVVALTVVTVAASWMVQRAWVSEPLACEWRALRAAVAAAPDARSIVAVPARAVDTTAPGLRYDLGWPASAKGWGPEPMVRAARRSLGLADVPVVIAPPGAPADAGAALVQLGCRAGDDPP